MRSLFLTIAVLLLLWPPVQAQDQSRFQQAALKYEQALSADQPQKKLDLLLESISIYRSLIATEGLSNSHLEYNLGTACLTAGMLGEAIYHLKRACLLDPNDARISKNLNLAAHQAKVEVSLPKRDDLTGLIQDFWKALPPGFWQLLSLGLSFFWAAVYLLKKSWRSGCVIAALLCVSTTCGLAVLREQGAFIKPECVLLKHYNPRKGQADNYPTALSEELRPGSVGLVLRSLQGWAEVDWYGHTGWVPLNDDTLRILKP